MRPPVKPTQRQPALVDTSDRDFQRRVVFGLVLVVLLFVGFGGWAASSSLSGAVIAPGRVVIESSVKKIQHLTGGIVKEIRVKNGDRVEAGDILLLHDSDAYSAVRTGRLPPASGACSTRRSRRRTSRRRSYASASASITTRSTVSLSRRNPRRRSPRSSPRSARD